MSKKYHEEHPTVSYRCRSIEEYNEIKKWIKISGKNESDFIREQVLQGVEKESKSYQRGYKDGINKLTVRCSFCKEYTEYKLAFADEQTREYYIHKMGLYPYHEKCLQKMRQQQATQDRT